VGYAPPEQYAGQSEPRSDVYALAATLYHLLTDDQPDQPSYDFPHLPSLDSELQRALASALERDVRQRATASKVRHDLEALASPAAAAFLFTFRNGETAHDVVQLARLCLRYRDEAKQYLASGDFEHRFRGLGRADLLQAVATAHKEADQEAGLEVFVRQLAPALSKARIGCPRRAGVGTLLPDQTLDKTVKLRNAGTECYLIGKISSHANWLRVSPADFKLAPGAEIDLTLSVSTFGQGQGQTLRTFLEIETLFEQRSIPVQVRVAFPWAEVLKRVVIGVGLGSLVGGGVALLLRLPVGGSGDWRWWGITVGLLGLILIALRKWAPGAWSRMRRSGCLAWLLIWALLAYLSYLLRYQFWSLAAVGGDVAPAWAAALSGGCIGAAAAVYRSLTTFNQRTVAKLLSAGLALLPLGLAMSFGGQVVVSHVPDFLNMPVPFIRWERVPRPMSSLPTLTPRPWLTSTPQPSPTVTRLGTATPERRLTSIPTPKEEALAPPTVTPTPTRATGVADCPNLLACITYPGSSDTLSGRVDILGSADIDRFDYYKFEFRPIGTPEWSFLVKFEQPVSKGQLMMWDTSTVPTGVYDLRLVVVDETGNYPEPCVIRVSVTR
jgi:hypothetical protein